MARPLYYLNSALRALGLAGLAIAHLAAALPASARAPAPGCPDCNLILISLSNVGASRMSLYGYRRKTTPHLDRWAEKALVFENAFTPASWTLPVGVSLFTSLQPYSHQILRRDLHNSLSPDLKTLPEVLRDHGYRTAAFTGGLDYFTGSSHLRGFQDTIDNGEFAGFNTTLPQAKAWLAKNSSQKFMLFLHGYDAHCPFYPTPAYRGLFSDPKSTSPLVDPDSCIRGYASPAPGHALGPVFKTVGACSGFRTHCAFGPEVPMTRRDIEALSDIYDEKLAEVDALVGEFLESLDAKLLEKTIVVVFADHGEMFEKHGRFGRAGNIRGTLYDDVTRVPLLMRFPKGPRRRVSGLAQLIDVMPTVLQELGVEMPPQRQGSPLLPALLSGAGPNRYVYAGASYGPHPSYYRYRSENDMIRDAHWKLIWEESTPVAPGKPPAVLGPARQAIELYDVEHDPQELHDLAEAQPAVAKDLLDKLLAWRDAARRSAGPEPAAQAMPQKLVDKARERGYW
ncbi:MAG: sulfatase [Elusimicrobia bacterium]|nr:sulfatase [Elusimicrobiota bacterium]